MRSKSNLLIKHFSKQAERLQKNKATLSFVAVSGSGMGKNQDPGSGINIPDPPHCPQHWKNIKMAYFKKL
jgi:hypothetical protein